MTSFVAFRVSNWDTPFWVNPNRRESRFSAGTSRILQYWSLHPLTPWAEQLRFLGVRDPDEVDQLRLRPWVATIDIQEEVVDLSFENAGRLGLDPDALIDDDWSRCQDWAASSPHAALLVPSAALPGTTNLVIFGPRRKIRYGTEPIDPSVEVPSDPCADNGICVSDLLGSIRWRGDLHAGYEAWLRGEPPPLPPSVHLDRI